MNIRKNLKNQRGFTLVEVIVVAVIVAALAAVAIPMYTSYVDSSRTNAAANAAGSVAAFMGACLNQGGVVEDAPTTETDGTPATVRCLVNNNSDTTTVQLPQGIRIRVSSDDGPGQVIARHVAGGDSSSYSY